MLPDKSPVTAIRTPRTRLRDRRAGDLQTFDEYVAIRVGSSIPALGAFAAASTLLAPVIGTLVGQGSAQPWWLQVLPILALLPLVMQVQRVRQPNELSVIALVCMVLLEGAFNLQGLYAAPGLPWIWPGTLMVPIASAIVWLRRWDFSLGMLLSAVGPLPMLLLNSVGLVQLVQYFVYMAVAVGTSVVLRSFISNMLIRQFRLEQQLREQATTDGLSGLSSRNYFLERATQALNEAGSKHKPSCLLYLDVDHFKSINDNYGHAAGDAALVALASGLRAHSRPGDLIGRIGGEEFVLVLPGAGLEQARRRAEEMRMAVHKIARPDGWLTVSIGVAECAPGTQITMEQLLARADSAMLQAKHKGRDQVIVAEAVAIPPDTAQRIACSEVVEQS